MKADYPDWVMAHKKKGTYINKVGDKYYLYAAHSERVKGTGKVRRVCDGYLGRITQTEGFIPARNSLKTEPVLYEIGLSYPFIAVSPSIHSGLCHTFHKYGDLVYACAVLSCVYGDYSPGLFAHSYLCLHFPDVSFPSAFTKAQVTGVERGRRMVEDQLLRKFGDDLAKLRSLFVDVRLLKMGNQHFLLGISDTIAALSEKYSIDWRNPLWQR